LQLYKHLSDEDNFYHSWRSVQGIFAAGATMVYSFWALRNSSMSIPLTETLKDLRTCSNLLSIGGEWWPSVKRGKESFERIVDLTIRKFGDMQEQQESKATKRRMTDSEVGFKSHVDSSTFLNWDPARNSEENLDTNQLPSLGNGVFSSPSDLLAGHDNLGHIDDVAQDLEQPNETDQALENFLADYLQSDFSWDPFAESLDDMGST
jgi:hypothetical protein